MTNPKSRFEQIEAVIKLYEDDHRHDDTCEDFKYLLNLVEAAEELGTYASKVVEFGGVSYDNILHLTHALSKFKAARDSK
jgi:hypothetical protein